MTRSLICGMLTLQACMPTLDTTEEIAIVAVTALEEPAGASGNAEPKYLEAMVESIVLVGEDGSETPLCANENADPLRIIARPSLFCLANVSTYRDETFSSLIVTFAGDLSSKGFYGPVSTTLEDPVAGYSDAPFTIAAAKDLRFEVKFKWKNTLLLDKDEESEFLESPAMEIALASP